MSAHAPHLPYEHSKHTRPGVGCGCVEPDHPHAFPCPVCGATYDKSEMLSFVIWRCYDCGGGWFTSEEHRFQYQRSQRPRLPK